MWEPGGTFARKCGPLFAENSAIQINWMGNSTANKTGAPINVNGSFFLTVLFGNWLLRRFAFEEPSRLLRKMPMNANGGYKKNKSYRNRFI